jgi:hypothetical protein
MPPRYAYWTILIDHKPTAFRAREKEELLPTFNQLRRKNSDVVFKWFARGRLWETPEEAYAALRQPKVAREKRGRDWRPGGAHADPRARFKKRPRPDARPRRDNDRDRKPDVVQALRPATNEKPRAGQAYRPASRRPAGAHSSRPAGPRESRPWSSKPGHTPKAPWRDGKSRQSFRPREERPKQRDMPPERRESEAPPKPRPDSDPEPPAPPEQIVIKPEPPERG